MSSKVKETLFQKEKRLKARKQVYKMTYKKGLFMINKTALCSWIMQDECLIRVHASGVMDDDTEFTSITIEGYNP